MSTATIEREVSAPVRAALCELQDRILARYPDATFQQPR
jgi:hypothetical protein